MAKNRHSNLKINTANCGRLLFVFFESQNRDAVAELRENGFETSSGSDSELDGNDGEIASTGSGDTEGRRNELESLELDPNSIFFN